MKFLKKKSKGDENKNSFKSEEIIIKIIIGILIIFWLVFTIYTRCSN